MRALDIRRAASFCGATSIEVAAVRVESDRCIDPGRLSIAPKTGNRSGKFVPVAPPSYRRPGRPARVAAVERASLGPRVGASITRFGRHEFEVPALSSIRAA
jgi:hypothetical protein